MVNRANIATPSPVQQLQPEHHPRQTNSTKKHIRGSSLLLAGRLISLALNFVVQIVTVRYLTKGDFGAFAYALSVVSMGASVCLLGLDKAVSRFLPIYQEQHDYRRLFGTILMTGLSLCIAGIALIVLMLGLQGILLGRFINDPLAVALLLIVIALAPLDALGNWFQALFAVFASPKAIFFRRHLLTPILRLLAILTVVAIQGNVYWLAAGYLIGGLISLIVSISLFIQIMRRQGIGQHFNRQALTFPARDIFGFSFPLLSTDIVLILKSSMVVVLLEYFHSTTGVAEFRAVLPVAGLNSVVMQSFKFLFTPLAARLYARNDQGGINDLYWQTAVWIAIISFPIFALTFSLAEPLVLLLFGQRYAGTGLLLALLSLGTYFNAALGFNAYSLRVYGRVRYIVTIDVASGIVSLLLSFLLIPRYGALGAAIAASGTLILYNIFMHIGLYKGTAIDLFQIRYLRVYLSIVVGAVLLIVVEMIFALPIYMNIILTGLISLALIRVNRNVLEIIQMFPELARIPLMRTLLQGDKQSVTTVGK